jgi:hypothetical protein
MERTYKVSGGVSPEAVNAEIARAWEDLQNDERLRAKVIAEGADLADLGTVDKDAAIAVSTPSGLAAETIIVAFLPVAVKIATDVWTHIILPRLKRKFGDDAIVESASGTR